MDRVSIGKRHGETSWTLILGPDASRSDHQELWRSVRAGGQHRVYREVWQFGTDGIRKKTLNRDTGEDIDSSSSSSSASSESSSSTAASNTSSSSVNSSSSSSTLSSSSSVNSSSSSSSTESSSSSS